MASGWDQGTGKVIRFNSRNYGATIWDQDAANGQVIDSLGHDVNDQTLADSISETLHIGGYNQMQADINAGGYKVTAMAPGTGNTDAVAIIQHYDTMDFDEGTRILTLSAPDGSSITEEIPAGVGGGTVTEITFGDGIQSTAEPLTSTGTISLAPAPGAPEGDYTGGIGRIIVDEYGRITDVEDGYGIGVTLGTTRDATIVTITNSAGSDAQIDPATATLAGVMTAADKVKLDGLVQNVDLANITTPDNVTITNTGGANTTIQEATGTRAGVMTVDMHNKLDSLSPGGNVPDGTTYGEILRWENSLGWQPNSIITVDGSGNVVLNPNSFVHVEADIDAAGFDAVFDEVQVSGLAVRDPLPNVEWYDTDGPANGRAFRTLVEGGPMRIRAVTDAGSGGSQYWEFTRSGNNITAAELKGVALVMTTAVDPVTDTPIPGTEQYLNGACDEALASYLTPTENKAHLDFLESVGVISPARATAIKAKIDTKVATPTGWNTL